METALDPRSQVAVDIDIGRRSRFKVAVAGAKEWRAPIKTAYKPGPLFHNKTLSIRLSIS